MTVMRCNVSEIQNTEQKRQIKNALNKINGVNKVAVGISPSIIEVQYNSPATDNQVKQCIEGNGLEISY